MGIIIWLLVGLAAGFIARFLVPGPDPMGIAGTLVLGLVGSLVGGVLANLVFEGDISLATSGLLGSIVGAVVALFVYRATRHRVATA